MPARLAAKPRKPGVGKARVRGGKVARLGIVREKGWLYWVRPDGVWRKTKGRSRGEHVVALQLEMDTDRFLYFIDGDGDIKCVRRQPGGPNAR